jgi:hypothetical protein
MEWNTIPGRPSPAASRRRRARFRLYEVEAPAADAEQGGFAGRWAGSEERPWYDRPAESEEAACELDDAEPSMC